jgi:hypothetical protein
LSEQIQLVEPSVSTDSRFLTSTFLVLSFLAATDKVMVIVASSPSGTLATIIPIPNTKFYITLYLRMKPQQKKITPMIKAMIVIILMNLSSSFLKGVLPASAESAKPAI